MLLLSNIKDNKINFIGDDDLKYVVLCQKDDAKAFSELVERHQKKMLNIAYRMLGDYDDACDVTQEAFIAAYKSIKKFKGDAKFSTWLYRIVINYSKNRLQQIKRIEKREGVSIDDSEKIKEKGVLFSSETIDANPGTQMEKREREEHVKKCISTLDEEFKEVLVLRDIQGFSYEEICAILKIPKGTVKSRLSRARNALKACLEKVIGDL